MFTSFTWEFFFSAAGVLLASYYGITILLLYHKEITQWFRQRTQPSPVMPELPVKNVKPSGIMGGVNVSKGPVPDRTTAVNADDIRFGDGTEEGPESIRSFDPAVPDSEHLLIGSVADLLQETKTLIQLIGDYKTDKAESASLFSALLLRYHHLRDTSYRQAIDRYICETSKSQFSFAVTPEEVSAWWEETANNS